jgi:exodeoxyribonuclease VII large subunit
MTIRSQDTNAAMTRDILTVAQLNQAVSHLLEDSFDACWVRGEISNFTNASSGHWYFTLKDDAASVRAVMFRSRAATTGFTPKAGDSVELKARVTLYEARGEYQLQVEQLRRAGLGTLFEAFVALKNKLSAEGLFDAENKRPLVPYPRAIGVITSLGAAALHDVLTALARRAPHVPVVIYPSLVQGAGAALQLRQALALANERQEVDTLLLVRGGGSLEDLFSFNDEALARDIAASVIPVVSGVGHETDFTIADFVADVRAPTPTAAAELVCATRQSQLERVLGAAQWAEQLLLRQLERLAQRVDRATIALVPPSQRVAHQLEKVAGLGHRVAAAFDKQFQRSRARHAQTHVRCKSLLPDLSALRARLVHADAELLAGQRRMLVRQQTRLESVGAQLRALSPEHTLARGYAIVRTEDKKILRKSVDAQVGQTLEVTLAEGVLNATVTQRGL